MHRNSLDHYDLITSEAAARPSRPRRAHPARSSTTINSSRLRAASRRLVCMTGQSASLIISDTIRSTAEGSPQCSAVRTSCARKNSQPVQRAPMKVASRPERLSRPGDDRDRARSRARRPARHPAPRHRPRSGARRGRSASVASGGPGRQTPAGPLPARQRRDTRPTGAASHCSREGPTGSTEHRWRRSSDRFNQEGRKGSNFLLGRDDPGATEACTRCLGLSAGHRRPASAGAGGRRPSGTGYRRDRCARRSATGQRARPGARH